MMRVGRPSVCSGGLNSSFFWPSLSKVNCWGVFECCIYNTWLILEEGECEKPQEYSAIPLWICMLSVSLCGERGSTVVEAYIYFSRGLFKYTLIIDGGSSIYQKMNFNRENPKFFSRMKGKMITVQWVTEKYRKIYLFKTKKWQQCHLFVNEIQKNFILIVFFSRISVFQLKDKKAKTNRVSFVASSDKAKGATSVSAQL